MQTTAVTKVNSENKIQMSCKEFSMWHHGKKCYSNDKKQITIHQITSRDSSVLSDLAGQPSV